MNTDTPSLEELWKYRRPTTSVDLYFSSHQGEFSLSRMKSLYPYKGNVWKSFRELPKINYYEGFHRFEGRGAGCWEILRDEICNNRTADLLAAADRLGGNGTSEGTYGPPGGFGVDQCGVWVGLLDGGVGVEVQVGQDEHTNRPEGWQRTTIRGPLAFRCLVELLGFDWIDQKLMAEEVPPCHAKITNLVHDLLTKSRL